MALGIVIGGSIAVNNYIIPAIAVLLAILAIQLCKKRLIEVLVDERINRISNKAAMISMRIFTIAATVTGIVMVMLRDKYPQLAPVGYTLAYSVCAFMLLFQAFYTYYSRKGKME
jgi:uncharacterized membrane protein